MSSTLKDIQYQYYDSLVSLITPIRDEIYYGGLEPHNHINMEIKNSLLTEALNIYTNNIEQCKTKEDTYLVLKNCMNHIYDIVFHNKII